MSKPQGAGMSRQEEAPAQQWRPMDPSYPTQLDALYKDSLGNPLICCGCAHSAAQEPFPGQPSGERPCYFCVRNVFQEAWRHEHLATCSGTVAGKNPQGETACQHPAHGLWYDGSPAVQVPMDCYRSADMVKQEHIWMGPAKNPSRWLD